MYYTYFTFHIKSKTEWLYHKAENKCKPLFSIKKVKKNKYSKFVHVAM